MPTLQIKAAAEKDIRNLDPQVRDRIVSSILALRENPFPRGTQKLRGLEDRYRMRVGDYRILYEFDPSAQNIIIYRVKHRREAYR